MRSVNDYEISCRCVRTEEGNGTTAEATVSTATPLDLCDIQNSNVKNHTCFTDDSDGSDFVSALDLCLVILNVFLPLSAVPLQAMRSILC